MPKPQPPQSLDDLLCRAEEFARFSLRARGKVPPALLAVGQGGPLFFVPSTLAAAIPWEHHSNLLAGVADPAVRLH